MKRKTKLKVGKTKQQVLFYLAAGFALGHTYIPQKQLWILRSIPKELEKINEYYLRRVIRELYNDKFIDSVQDKNGNRRIILTVAGKKEIGRARARSLAIQKPKKWDRRWHIVFYDIPEKHKKGRDILRNQLKTLGFYELQKSIWVYPYPCKEVIRHLINFYNMNDYVQYATITEINNDKKLRKSFKL